MGLGQRGLRVAALWAMAQASWVPNQPPLAANSSQCRLFLEVKAAAEGSWRPELIKIKRLLSFPFETRGPKGPVRAREAGENSNDFAFCATFL